jgi:hypothetical protein
MSFRPGLLVRTSNSTIFMRHWCSLSSQGHRWGERLAGDEPCPALQHRAAQDKYSICPNYTLVEA